MNRSLVTLSRTLILSTLAAAGMATSASAAFNTFVIRGAPVIQTNNVYTPGAQEFIISAGGQKAGWGTDAMSGATLSAVTQMAITRHDDSTRFTTGSGPAVAPYFNIWVTDGTNYAVVANEPSNGSFAAFRTAGPNGGFTYAFSMNDIANEPARIFEAPNASALNSWVHIALNKVGQNLLFSDVMGLTMGAPSPSYIAGGNGIGTGAPRELGSNAAVSFNWIFGDTLSNYVSGNEGYVVSNPLAVPAPGAFALIGLGGLVAGRRRRSN